MGLAVAAELTTLPAPEVAAPPAVVVVVAPPIATSGAPTSRRHFERPDRRGSVAAMFDAVRFASFKSLADVTIELGRLTLLVGANASGKSSVLDGLHLLCQLGAPRAGEQTPDTRPRAVFSRARSPVRLHTWGAETPLEIEARAGLIGFAVKAKADEEHDHFVVQLGVASRIERFEFNGAVTTGAHFFKQVDPYGFGNAVRLRLDSTKIARFAEDSVRPRVEHDGTGTATVLAWLAEERSSALEDIEHDLRIIVPQARRLLPERAEIKDKRALVEKRILGRRFSLEMSTGARIPADLLSEGTLLTIGLLTVLHQRPTPRLVLLDDFDRALHPKAQRQLVACVKSLLDRNPDLQFVCTTHSPYVLDLFEADDVRVLRTDGQGHTLVRKLTDHPEWAVWKETMKAGEFWSYVGEDWLDAAERPA